MLVVVSASWTMALAQGGSYHDEAGRVYYYLNADSHTATVTNKKMSATGNKYYSQGSYSNAVYIPETITVNGNTYTVTSIQDYAFYECSEIKTISIPKTIVEIGKQAFVSCSGLSKVDVDSYNTKFYSDNGVLFDKAQTTLIVYPSAKVEGSTTYTVPAHVKTIKAYAFSQNVNLEKIILPAGLETIETYAFSDNKSLREINLPESLTTIEPSAFYNCKELSATMTIPSKIYKLEDYIFMNCEKLSNVVLPKYMESIGSSVFKGCTSLKSIELPSNLKAINQSVFSGSGLESITIPSEIKEIPSFAFEYCNLKTVNLPEGLTIIDSYAFRGNKAKIENVNFPKSLASINNDAFAETNVSNFYVYNTPRNLEIAAKTPFKKGSISDMKIHVYTLMKDIFATSGNWANYAENIVADIDIEHISNITLDKTEISINLNSSDKITATVNPSDAVVKEVTFTSSDESVVIITNSETGSFATTNKEGSATITCTAADGSGKTAVCTVNVVKNFVPSTGVTVTGAPTNMDVNETKQVYATVAPTNATMNSVTWLTSNKNIATVSSTGLITALAPGAVTITAMANDGNSRVDFDIAVSYGTYTLTDGTKYNNEKVLSTKKLNYTRNYNNTAWQPLYVPFRMSYNDWCDKFEVAKLLNIHSYDNNNDGQIDALTLEIVVIKDGTLKENHPYMIKAKTTGEQTISVPNADIYPAATNSIQCASTEYTYDFNGVYENKSGIKGIGGYIMSGGILAKPSSEATVVKPYRWYMQITSKEGQIVTPVSSAKVVVIDIDGDAETTDINSINENTSTVNAIYNTNGVQLPSLRQGLNIIKMSDGTTKKIFIK